MNLGDRIEKTGGDYRFVGTVVGVLTKLSGEVRIVAENADGLLFIFNPSQLVNHGPAATADLERRAPVQDDDLPSASASRGKIKVPSGTISWTEHCEAWTAYAARYGRDQSAERLAERGGFGFIELVQYLGRPPKTWRPR